MGHRGDGGGHPAVVAPPRGEPGGPPPAAHGRAAVTLARRERGVSRGPGADRPGWGRLVGDEHRLVRPRGVGDAGRGPVCRHGRSPRAPPDPLASRPRRPRRARRAGAGRARPAEPRGLVGSAVRGRAPVRRGRRRARGDERDEPLRRRGTPSRRLRPGGPVRCSRNGPASRLRKRPRRIAVGELRGPQLPARDGRHGAAFGAGGLRGDGHPSLRRADRDRAGGSGRFGAAHPRPGLAAVAPRERLDARAAHRLARPGPARHGGPRPGRLPQCGTSTAASVATASPTTAG